MEAGKLQFCFYYKADDMDVDRFLDFICAHMGKWDPYDYVDRFSRYQSLLFVLCGNPGKEFLGFFFFEKCHLLSWVLYDIYSVTF